MSDGTTQPDKEVFAQEFEMFGKRIEREKAIAKIIASVPEDEPHRDKLIGVLRLTTSYDPNFSVVRSYLQSPDRKPDQNPTTIESRLSKRDFFSDPAKKKEFGSQVLDRAREIILEFAKPRTGKYGK